MTTAREAELDTMYNIIKEKREALEDLRATAWLSHSAKGNFDQAIDSLDNIQNELFRIWADLVISGE